MSELDVFTQQSDIERRRKLLDSLGQQSMSAPIVGNTGLGQALAKIASAYVQSKGQQELAGQASDNRAAYNTQLHGELGKYLDTYQGKKAEGFDGAFPGTDPGESFTPGVKANPREAIVSAMTSNFPEMQQMGKSGMAELAAMGKKQQIAPADMMKLAPHVTTASLVAAMQSGDMSQLRQRPSEHVVNNRIVTGNDGKYEVGADMRDQYSDVGTLAEGPDGQPIVGAKEKGTNKPLFAPAGTKVNVNTAEQLAAEKALGAKVPDTLEAARNTVMTAQGARQNAQQLYALLQDPAIQTGFAANVGAGMSAVGAKLGWEPGTAAAKTQQGMALLAKQTLEATKQLKGAISDKEKPFLEEAAAGRITWTKETMETLAHISLAAAHNAEMLARAQWRGTVSTPGAANGANQYPLPAYGNMELPQGVKFNEMPDGRISYGGFTPAPQGAMPQGGTPGSSPMSLEDYLKSKGL